MSRNYKAARLARKLKVSEVMVKLGVSQPTLSAWENERKAPGITNLENMADLYGVTTDYLLGTNDKAWIEPISPDSLLREGLRGWYKVHPRWVENERGNRFFFEYLGVKWLAFPSPE